MTTDYQQFLESKRMTNPDTGFEPDMSLFPEEMFDFQRDCCSFSLKKGRSALFLGTGLGKSLISLAWADQVCKHTGGDVLILAPLAVAPQTVREGQKFGIDVNYCRGQSGIKPGINITNYEMLEHFDTHHFAGVVLDECFAYDTPVDVFLDGQVLSRHISNINVGDEIVNASGIDTVSEIHKRRIDECIAVNIRETGRRVICSPNHPWFTSRGWVHAKHLRETDILMETAETMRMVREYLLPSDVPRSGEEILQSILFSEMENEQSYTQSKSSHKGNTCKNRRKNTDLEDEWISIGIKSAGAYPESQSDDESRIKRENVPHAESNGAQTFKTWRKWDASAGAPVDIDGLTTKWMDSRICYLTGETETRISDLLQSGLGECREENCYRSGWSESQGKEKETGRKEGRCIRGSRVESIEILKSGDYEFERLRESDGNVYLYDIKATRHPSFSVDGYLVHNSSILKSFSGKIRNQIIDSFCRTQYKLSCTATPSPNDHMELGNQCEFLGIMNYSEMLATYFVHDGGDTSKWRVKGHAVEAFWQWVASWAVMMQNPRDLGYDGSLFDLPPLNMVQHTVTPKSSRFQGRGVAKTLNDRRDARRESLNERVAKAAEIVNASDETFVCWTGLNAESVALEKLIPDAVEVTGSDKPEYKEKMSMEFVDGNIRVLVTKGEIFGMGLNWQHCHNMIFCGLSDSWEMLYQSIRRCWRFGQDHQVNVHIITSEAEGAVVKNIKEKEKRFNEMLSGMISASQEITKENIRGSFRMSDEYNPQEKMVVPGWL
jgi:hypothetical protein